MVSSNNLNNIMSTSNRESSQKPEMNLIRVQASILTIIEMQNKIREQNLTHCAVEKYTPEMERYLLTMPEEDFLRFPGACLLLGMVCHNILPIKGAARRDSIAAFGLAALGYFVTSLNNDVGSAGVNPGRHIEVNLNSARHVKQEIEANFPSYYSSNDDIICDIGIFRSPTGYVDSVLTNNFWQKTLIWFLDPNNKLLKPGGKIHFGNIAPIREKLREFKSLISPLCDMVEYEFGECNPIHVARELMSKELEECGDHITNATQMIPIKEHSDYEYIVLTKKSNRASELMSFNNSSSSPKDCTPTEVIRLRNSVNHIPFYDTLDKPTRRSCFRSLSEIIDLTLSAETDDEEMVTPPLKRRNDNKTSIGRVPIADFNYA